MRDRAGQARIGKSLNESKREEESRGRSGARMGWFKGGPRSHERVGLVRVHGGRSSEGGRAIATVSRIKMLRTPYNGHSSELKPLVRALQQRWPKGRDIPCKIGFNADITMTVT